MSGQALIVTARSFIGTPFVHQARRPGVGLDCVGLIACSARATGYKIKDLTCYGRESDPKALIEAIEWNCFKAEGPWLAGDVLLFWLTSRTQPQHAGIFVGSTFIHAHSRPGGGAVREELLSAFWVKHIYQVYRLKPELLEAA